MEIKRTANAGVLLRLDGKSILLDGVCEEVKPYLPTPDREREELLNSLPDAVAFTHHHRDHCDDAFVSAYQKTAAGPILGPADIPFSTAETVTLGDVRITQIPTRHLGAAAGIGHHSFIVEGSQCVWFLGDAAPAQFRKMTHLPRPDVLIAPFAYGIGSSWKLTGELGPDTVVLVHLPNKDCDPYELWDSVEKTIALGNGPAVVIPEMGATVNIPNRE